MVMPTTCSMRRCASFSTRSPAEGPPRSRLRRRDRRRDGRRPRDDGRSGLGGTLGRGRWRRRSGGDVSGARVAPLAQADAEAYVDALGALRVPEQLEERYRDQKLQAALAKAAEIPQRIAEAGSDLACLAALLVENGQSGGACRRRAASIARRVRNPRRREARRDQPRRRPTTTRVRHVQHARCVGAEASQRALPPRSSVCRCPVGRPRDRARRCRQEPRAGLEPPGRTRSTDRAPVEWPGEVTREWAWGGRDRRGRARLHPRQRRRARTTRSSAASQESVAVSIGGTTRSIVEEDTEGDLCGHGTACAGIVRSLAPDCEICERPRARRRLHRAAEACSSPGCAGRWSRASTSINMSLSTTKQQFAGILHELADTRLLPPHRARRVRAQHAGRELSVALLVGDLGRQPRGVRPARLLLQPDPPVEFFARGVDVEVAWTGGGRPRLHGQQLRDAAHAGICALVL